MSTHNHSPVTLISLYDPDAIGIRILATMVKERMGITINQIFFKNLFPEIFPYTDNELRLLTGQIKNLNTKLLGISLRSPSLKTALTIIEKVREQLPDIKIIIGGTHAIISPEECIEVADIVCIGEGEYPFLDLIGKYFHGDLEEIKNIEGLWVKINGNIHKNPVNTLIDIDEVPLIDYSGKSRWYIENDSITPGDPLVKNAVGEIFSSRGCPYHCTYCTNNILKGIMHKGKFVRQRSVENVIKDIKNLHTYFKNLKKIVFADEVFAMNRRWILDFCKRYKEEINLPFAALFYPDGVKEEIVFALKEAGLTHARMGIQAGSEHIRKDLYERNEKNRTIIDVTKIFHHADIRLTYDIIVNNPYETKEDLKSALTFYSQIPKPFELNMHSLVYFPKTTLTKKALLDGIIEEKHVEGPADEALRLNHVLLKDKKMIYGYKNNLFFNSLFSLTSKSIIPVRLIDYLYRTKSLRENSNRLLYFAKIVNIINIGFIGIGLLKRGEIGIKEALAAVKGIAATSSVNK